MRRSIICFSCLSRVVLCVGTVLALAPRASAGIYNPPLPSEITGTTPSGLQWSAVATGTALPVRTSGSAAGPGAVVYFNTVTGQLQLDTKGYNLNTVIITYTTGSSVTSSTPGPFTYATGTGANAYSPTTGTPRTLPAKDPLTSGLAPTTFPSRVGITIGTLSALLASSGDSGNVGSTGGSGFWNVSWSFPLDLVASGSVSSMAISNFKTIGQNSNANANILGYGLGLSTFQYGINGVVGNQVGAVIPVVPEPSTCASLLSGLAFGGYSLFRRRRAR